jgi:hypothetical protein
MTEIFDWLDAFAREHHLGPYRQKHQLPPPEPRDRGEGVFGVEVGEADPSETGASE